MIREAAWEGTHFFPKRSKKGEESKFHIEELGRTAAL
jgi:hypothetical protein